MTKKQTKTKENDGFGGWGFLILVVLIGGLITGLFYLVDVSTEKYNCLKPIAQDICKEKNMGYDSNTKIDFRCVSEDRRSIVKMRFHEEELEGCIK